MFLTRIKFILLGFVALYLIAGAGLALFQHRMVFLPPDRPFADCELPEGVTTVNIEGERALFHPANENPGRKIVVVYHGNKEEACFWRELGSRYTAGLGYDTLVPEYPGYGQDGRRPSAEGVRQLVLTVERWIAQKGYEEVAVIGFSLGTGPASFQARGEAVDKLFLLAPYDSVYRVALWRMAYYPPFLLRDNFDNVESLSQSKASILILHGTRDWIIPAERSERLYRLTKEAGVDIARVVLEGAVHLRFEMPYLDERVIEAL